MIRETVGSVRLAKMLAVRDIKAQYRKSLFGILWAFVPPIVLAFGLTYARRAKVLNPGESTIPYAAYIITSMALWQTFVAAVYGPMRGLSRTKEMLCKVYFPRETVILSELLKVCFYFLFELALLIGVFVWFKLQVGWTILGALPALGLLIVFGISIGMLIAPIALLFEDVGNAMGPVMYAWMIMTPVLYPVPKFSGGFTALVHTNPVTVLLVTTRELLLGESLSFGPAFMVWVFGVFIVLLFAGIFFRIAMPFVIERWSS